VKGRSEAHAKIEKDFIELTDCFQQLESIVINQETKIIASEKASGDVLKDGEKASEDLGPAVKHAKTRRRNQRRAIMIVSAVVLTVIAAVVAVVAVKKNASGNA
jgi:syntaxin 1B/2/3